MNAMTRPDRGGYVSATAHITSLTIALVLYLGVDPTTTSAQAPRWELDVSGSRIEYDSLAPLNAPSIAAFSDWQRPAFFGRLSGSVTGFQSSGWSGQGRGDVASWLSPFGVLNPLRLEFGATAAGSRHSSGFNSIIGRGDARLHLRGRTVGGWAGASVASARNSFDTASVTGVIPSVGLWAQNGSVRATLSFLGTRLSGDTYPETNLALSLTRGPLDVTVYGGHRQAPSTLPVSDESWAGATAAVWVHPRAALIVSGGRYASDVMQGLPGGQFVSFGLRLTRRRTRPIPVTTPAPIVYTPEAARTGSISFEVDGAEQVEIAGDWTALERVPLTRDAMGRWLVPATLAPGVYRFNLRVDGERWFVPEGVAEIDDGYGGRVGLLIISDQR
jgi:hypothetical protein